MSGLFLCIPHRRETALESTSLKIPVKQETDFQLEKQEEGREKYRVTEREGKKEGEKTDRWTLHKFSSPQVSLTLTQVSVLSQKMFLH